MLPVPLAVDVAVSVGVGVMRVVGTAGCTDRVDDAHHSRFIVAVSVESKEQQVIG